MSDAPADDRPIASPGRYLVAVARCVRFYSRLPMPRVPGEGDPHAVPDFTREPAGLPFAALLIAGPAALAMLAAGLIGLDPALSGALAVAALVLASGAFHEDGLADTADGLFGGHTAERRLEIMKDSRIGVFAGVAIGLTLLLRTLALAAILDAGGVGAAVGAVLVAAMVSRMEGVRVLASLPSARAYGAAAAVGRPTVPIAVAGYGLALALGLVLCVLCGLSLVAAALGVALGSLLVTALAALSRRLIGGQTGDIAGAAQQLSEIGFYVGAAVALAG
jgi:adenosylcobinamide-GDP ribazoletransferase